MFIWERQCPEWLDSTDDPSLHGTGVCLYRQWPTWLHPAHLRDTALGTCSGILDLAGCGWKGHMLELNKVQPPRIDFTHILDLL